MLAEPTKMPENLENLSIPELEALLFSDFVNTKDSPNTDFIIKVMEVIAKKEQESACYEPINIDQAWSDFQEFYLEKQLDSPSATVHIQKKTFRPFRRLICIAAIVAVIIAMATIPVMGYRSVFHMIGTWTSEQFRFAPADQANAAASSNNNQINTSKAPNTKLAINDALIRYGVIQPLLPAVIPEGFEQIEFDVTEKPSGNVLFYACYKNGNDLIMLNAVIYANSASMIYEKTPTDAEIYSNAGLNYYVFSNSKNNIAAVFYDNVEASVRTNLSRSDLLNLLSSSNMN